MLDLEEDAQLGTGFPVIAAEIAGQRCHSSVGGDDSPHRIVATELDEDIAIFESTDLGEAQAREFLEHVLLLVQHSLRINRPEPDRPTARRARRDSRLR